MNCNSGMVLPNIMQNITTISIKFSQVSSKWTTITIIVHTCIVHTYIIFGCRYLLVLTLLLVSFLMCALFSIVFTCVTQNMLVFKFQQDCLCSFLLESVSLDSFLSLVSLTKLSAMLLII